MLVEPTPTCIQSRYKDRTRTMAFRGSSACFCLKCSNARTYSGFAIAKLGRYTRPSLRNVVGNLLFCNGLVSLCADFLTDLVGQIFNGGPDLARGRAHSLNGHRRAHRRRHSDRVFRFCFVYLQGMMTHRESSRSSVACRDLSLTEPQKPHMGDVYNNTMKKNTSRFQ